MSPEDVADAYFAAIRAKDIEGLMTLYAEDAIFTLPNGKSFAGKEAIRQMHLGVFSAGAPTPSPSAKVVGQDAIAVEIEARLADGTTRQTANFYRFGQDGLIRSLGVYMRS